MKTNELLYELRIKNNMTQDELAEKLFVTRQAISRWENGETVPNTDTLKLLSEVFNVSIDALLGSPRQLICQCCGMPLDQGIISHNQDGSLNEDYCKWCYADGTYTYENMDDLIDVCIPHMEKEGFTKEQARDYMKNTLPKLDYWKRHEELSDHGEFEKFKQKLVEEINDLNIKGMPKLEKLSALVGEYVNIDYPLPNGAFARFLNNETTYLGYQLESTLEEGKCFGIVANVEFILIAKYGEEGKDAELVLYKKRM